MMSNWTVGRRIAAGFAAIVAVTVVMGAVASYTLHSVVVSKDAVIEVSAQNRIDAERLHTLQAREVAQGRAFVVTGDARFEESRERSDRAFEELLGAIERRTDDPTARRLIAAVRQSEERHQTTLDAVLSTRGDGVSAELGLERFDAQLAPRSEALEGSIAAFAARARANMDRRGAAATATAQRAEWLIIALAIFAAVCATLIGLLLTRTLSRHIGSSVAHVRSSSVELEAAATQQASGSKEQAAAMTEIATTIGELLATSRQIAESAQRVVSIATETAEGAQQGDETVGSARTSMASIEQQVAAIVSHMLELGRKSQQVGGIVEIINELAEQTNILAINATIEAAGAGEAGKRFAVVGDEIRKLADRVAGSTREIRTLIDDMRSAVNATVMATETGSKTVTAGTETFGELAGAFERIGELVSTTVQAAREIELSTKQQATAVEQVNSAIGDVAQTTREMESSSAQTLSTASELSKVSDELNRFVEPSSAS